MTARASMRAVWLAAGLTALAVLGSACGTSGTTEASEDATPDDVEAGRVAFERSCSACHGVGAAGTQQGPPLVHELYEPSHHADGAFLFAVRNGVRQHHWGFGDMPRQEGVADDDVARIVAYVRSLQREAGIYE